MKILIAQTGLHHITRGAEIAFTSVATELVRAGLADVTLCGMGPTLPDQGYRYVRSFGVSRRRFSRAPMIPPLRDATHWEDLFFAAGLRFRVGTRQFDVTMTSDFPFTQLALRGRFPLRQRTPHVYVTHSSDWAAHAGNAEYRFFKCDGLICINPDYYERNQDRWFSRMIPNGVDVHFFCPGEGDRERFGIPAGGPVILLVAALVESKRVVEGIKIAARTPDAIVVVAGSGPLQREVAELGSQLLGERFVLREVDRSEMGLLYRTADLFLHMSKDEPGALVYSEALASGLPIVAHDTSVTRWLIGQHATLLDTDDEAAVAEAIERELSANCAGKVASRVESARSRYSWEVVAGQTHAFLGEVIDRAAAR
jgi:glycosyltransferase involved in cell wall biosynthesis